MRTFEGFIHGINLAGWFSQCDHTKERYDHFITEEDFQRIASFKTFDHVRLPIDYDLVETKNGEYIEEGFARIAQAVSLAEKYGLHIILDLHKTFGYSFDQGEKEEGFFREEAYQERFYRLWEEFAKRFGDKTPLLAFELLNEVTDKEYCDAWNRISLQCIERIRKIAPTIKILVGGYHYNNVTAVKDLAPPYDENIVYNFHCYDPHVFTHQGAYWIDTMPTDFRFSIHENFRTLREKNSEVLSGMNNYDSVPDDAVLNADFFKTLFSEAVSVAEERNVPLYCGEFGVIDLAEPEEALLWIRMITEAFRDLGIGHSLWCYKEMDFGLIDPHMDRVREDVLAVL